MTGDTVTGDTATGDPAALDAVEESEDMEAAEENMNEEAEESEDAMPNNDFCFTNDDFIEYRTGINDATRHQGKYREAWATIKSLEGHEEIYSSSSDGKVVWTVVDKVVDDDFETIR